MEQHLEDYLLAHIDSEPPHLHRLDRESHLMLVQGRMCSGHLQGRLLKMLVRMIKPRLVLELGTYSAYSALCLAEGLMADEARVHTIEIEDELEDFIRHQLQQAPWGHRVTLHMGDAMEVVPRLGLTFDLAFIDANKRHYPQYYHLVMQHLAPGGFIIADNTLWDGKVAAPPHHETSHQGAMTQGILDFNDIVAADPRVERVILPLRDGLTLIHKLP